MCVRVCVCCGHPQVRRHHQLRAGLHPARRHAAAARGPEVAGNDERHQLRLCM